MRIGYLVPRFPGQSHIYFWRDIRALEALGHHVDVLSSTPPPEPLLAVGWAEEAIARTTFLGGINVPAALGGFARLLPRGLPLWMAQGGLGFSRDALLTLSAAQQLLSRARAERLEHIHVQSCGRAAVIAALARRMGGPRYSLMLHGPLSGQGPGQRFKWQGAGFGAVLTQQLWMELQAALDGALPERVGIAPVGVDIDALSRTAPYVPPTHGKPVKLFSCARLSPEKGHQDLLHAMRLLLDQGVDVRLEIAGEDEDGGTGFRLVLEKQLKDQHLRDHVKLLGAISPDAVREKLMDSQIFAQASWQEPLGMACMEAMACGVPCIATEAGGVPELIEDGVSGRLVPPRNPRMMAQAIRDLSNDPEAAMRLSLGGRARVEAQFTLAQTAAVLSAEILRLRPATQAVKTENITAKEV
ncbi:hypothetical protein P775_01695 [Puniceibacterium antarcticum]|uniref:Glycosyl transferase family 1 domain-containing protein n=1 Tax=Puniceibacterium antarcticum TaxID=1206336 RepID=A0A2G8RK46_9RHOB|nr:hypothetical protein P775_01695 [Puniceibacterium antarcticum]